MAGTPNGRIDCFANTGAPVTNVQEAFKTLFDFLSASASWTRIAYFFGTTGGSIAGATAGSDYWDGATPFMRHAFAVFEATNGTPKPWYLLIEFIDGSADAVPGGTIAGGSSGTPYAGIGVQMACAVGAGGTPANPWNGTTNNNGTDTKGTPWWVAPGGGGKLYCFPRCNSAGGGAATNANDLAWAYKTHYYSLATQTRFHIVTDDDCIVFLIDEGNDGGVFGFTGGYYTPRADLTVDRPLVMMGVVNSGANALPHQQRFGSVSGVGDDYPGGVHAGVGGTMPGVVAVALDRFDFWNFTDVCYPNKAFSPAAFDTFPLFIGAYEVAPTVYAGYLGTYPFVRDAYHVVNNTTNVGKTRACFGPASPLYVHISIPWDGVTVPDTNATRAGVSF
jgi:hypothetical protein